MSRTAAVSVLAVALCASVADAAAQQPGQGEPEGSTWGLGIGVVSTQKPYTGIDRENRLLPLITFENRYVRVFGPAVEVKLPSLDLGGSQRVDFRLVARMNIDGAGYEDNDAPILGGMDERKGGFWAGGKVEWKTGVADLSAEWLGDVSSNSEGQRFSLGLEKTWVFGGRLLLTPRLGVAWVDKKYVDYYFGVRSDEAIAGRPAYEGDSGVIPGVGVRAIYRLDAHQSLMFDARVARLPTSIKDSPLVDASTENRVLFGYMYRF